MTTAKIEFPVTPTDTAKDATIPNALIEFSVAKNTLGSLDFATSTVLNTNLFADLTRNF